MAAETGFHGSGTRLMVLAAEAAGADFGFNEIGAYMLTQADSASHLPDDKIAGQNIDLIVGQCTCIPVGIGWPALIASSARAATR